MTILSQFIKVITGRVDKQDRDFEFTEEELKILEKARKIPGSVRLYTKRKKEI